MPRLLVIDDDAALTTTLVRGLAYEGFDVDVAASGPAGLTQLRDRAADLVILDVMLPGLDGFEVLRRLRSAHPGLPVLMLTARDHPDDQVRGLDHGADDYVVKPFAIDVLVARVRALLRRAEATQSEVLRFADLALDTAARRARRGTRDIDLTATEYEVLHQFLRHPRRVLAQHHFMERIWGHAMEGSSNLVEVYVKQLRRKLEAGGATRLLHTSRGAGYILREP
jgi:DNA-binding response OmpR family regulator